LMAAKSNSTVGSETKACFSGAFLHSVSKNKLKNANNRKPGRIAIVESRQSQAK